MSVKRFVVSIVLRSRWWRNPQLQPRRNVEEEKEKSFRFQVKKNEPIRGNDIAARLRPNQLIIEVILGVVSSRRNLTGNRGMFNNVIRFILKYNVNSTRCMKYLCLIVYMARGEIER